MNEVEFLELVVNDEGLKPSLVEIRDIRDMPPPKNVKQVLSFLHPPLKH